MTGGQRFARVATSAVVRAPWLWPLFRRPLSAMFDRIAPTWDERRSAGHLAPLEAALERLPAAPRRVLDLGTGTGAAAVAAARRFPESVVVGVDVAPGMVEVARRRLPPELRERVRFDVADAAHAAFDEPFDLVLLANMIPFFDELRRLTAPGGHAIFSFSLGEETPIYVPPERLRRELGRRGFSGFEEVAAGPGTALLASRA